MNEQTEKKMQLDSIPSKFQQNLSETPIKQYATAVRSNIIQLKNQTTIPTDNQRYINPMDCLSLNVNRASHASFDKFSLKTYWLALVE